MTDLKGLKMKYNSSEFKNYLFKIRYHWSEGDGFHEIIIWGSPDDKEFLHYESGIIQFIGKRRYDTKNEIIFRLKLNNDQLNYISKILHNFVLNDRLLIGSRNDTPMNYRKSKFEIINAYSSLKFNFNNCMLLDNIKSENTSLYKIVSLIIDIIPIPYDEIYFMIME